MSQEGECGRGVSYLREIRVTHYKEHDVNTSGVDSQRLLDWDAVGVIVHEINFCLPWEVFQL